MKTMLLKLRKKIAILLAALMFVPMGMLCAQNRNAPQWIDYAYREAKYPKSSYVIGFTSEEIATENDKQEAFDRLKNHARIQLTESVIVSIKSITTSEVAVSNTITNEDFRKISVSLSNVNVSGLTEETFYDEKKKICYALSYASKNSISELHRNIIKNNLNTAIQKIDQAKTFTATGSNNMALERFCECYPLFREIEEAQSLIIALEGQTTDFPALMFQEVAAQKQIVEKEVNKLQGSSKQNLDELCFLMANAMSIQIKNSDADIFMGSFTYSDSKMWSSFSKRFADLLEAKLSAKNINVSRITGTDLDGQQQILSGTYWEEGDNIKVIAVLRNLSNGKTMAATEGTINKQWLNQNNVQYLPDNYNEAKKEVDIFYKDDVVSQGGLYVDVTTNRGNNNPVFIKNDTLKLYVRTNKECYIRLIYYFADGSKVLFFDNYYVAPDQVNQLIPLAQYFECVAPFGVETLQLNAQTKPFAPLNTNEQSGIKFINENTENIISSLRAFRPVKNDEARAEKRIVITTLPE